MKTKGKRVFKNGAVGAYVYYKKEKKWKWRIIAGPKKKNIQFGGAKPEATPGLIFEKFDQKNVLNHPGNVLNNFGPPTTIVPDWNQSIIFIPGWLCDAANSYQYLLLYLDSQQYNGNIYLYDPPGIGVNKDYEHIRGANQCGIEAQALSLARLIIKNKLTNVNLVGHSMGAIVALITNTLLKNNTNVNINSVTLLDPTPINSPIEHVMQEMISTVCKTRLNTRNKRISESELGKHIMPIVDEYPYNIKIEAFTVSTTTLCQTFDNMSKILSKKVLTKLISDLPERSQILLQRGNVEYLNMHVNKIFIIPTNDHFIQIADAMRVVNHILRLIEPVAE
jgi:hypothetical protein